MLFRLFKMLIALFAGSQFFTGCYIPPNTHVGMPAPHSYHQPHYYDDCYYCR